MPPYFLIDQIELTYSKAYRLTIMYIICYMTMRSDITAYRMSIGMFGDRSIVRWFDGPTVR